jgi:hypothetical protein
MTHVRTSPHYPQSNGEAGAVSSDVKHEAVRRQTPLELADTRRIVAYFVAHYNTVRLHSAIGYVPPQAKLESRDQQILAVREERLAAAREQRRQRRAAERTPLSRMARCEFSKFCRTSSLNSVAPRVITL